MCFHMTSIGPSGVRAPEEDKLLEPANLVRRKKFQSQVPTANILKNSVRGMA